MPTLPLIWIRYCVKCVPVSVRSWSISYHFARSPLHQCIS